MLKSRLDFGNLSLNAVLLSEHDSSDSDFRSDKVLNEAIASAINPVIDGELFEYSGTYNKIQFNLFFIKNIYPNEVNEMSEFIDTDFTNHIHETRLALGLVDENGKEYTKIINNPYEHRQLTDIKEPEIRFDKKKTRESALLDKPYALRDFIGELAIKKPKKGGYPVFYNSFAIPYWPSKDSWIDEPLLFTNKSFHLNSFLLIEFFDTTDTLTQKRLFSIPIFNNMRYCFSEKPKSKDYTVDKPVFVLEKGTEGHSLMFLSGSEYKELYAKFSFWDALNGVKIPLLPSAEQFDLTTNAKLGTSAIKNGKLSVLFNEKKWIQNPTNFDSKDLYLKYVLNDEQLNYKIYEYDKKIDAYELERSTFDLYQLVFDDFWVRTPVKNKKPTEYKAQPAAEELYNPLKFNIKNVNVVKNVGSTPFTIDYTINTKAKTYHDLARGMMQEIANVINIKAKKKNKLNLNNSSLFEIPVNGTVIEGYSEEIASFSATNKDDKSYEISELSFTNLMLLTDTDKMVDTAQSFEQSAWNVVDKHKICEALFLPINKGVQSNYKTIADDILTRINLTKILLDEIQKTIIANSNADESNDGGNEYDENGNNISNNAQNNPTANFPTFGTTSASLLLKRFYMMVGLVYPTLLYESGLLSNIAYELDMLLTKLLLLDDMKTIDLISASFIYKNPDYTSVIQNIERVKPYLAFDDLYSPIYNLLLNETYGIAISDTQIINAINKNTIGLKINNEKDIRNYLIDLVIVLSTKDYFIIAPDGTINFKLVFNYGGKILYLLDSEVLKISGNIKLKLIGEDKQEKNIMIPIKFTITP